MSGLFRAVTYVAVGFSLSALARALGMEGWDYWSFLIASAWVVGVIVSGGLTAP